MGYVRAQLPRRVPRRNHLTAEKRISWIFIIMPVIFFIFHIFLVEMTPDMTLAADGVSTETTVAVNLTIYSSSSVGIYSENAKGLMKSLVKAVSAGCGNPSVPTEIILMRDSMPNLKQYILFQMEQTYGRYFTDEYVELMKGAVQVWFFSPIMLEQVRERYGIDKGFYVPLFLTVDTENPQYQCSERQREDITPGTYQLYFNGTYAIVGVQERNTLKIQGISSTSQRGPNEMKDTILQMFYQFDVLYFGEISGSYQNQREGLCNRLMARGFKIMCVQRTIGAALEYLVCRAKVVVVDSFHLNASLSTHRIDPLILAEKIVLAKQSHDPYLDMVYSPSIEFTDDIDLDRTLSLILREYGKYQRQMTQKKINFVNSMSSLTPLCYALNHLS